MNKLIKIITNHFFIWVLLIFHFFGSSKFHKFICQFLQSHENKIWYVICNLIPSNAKKGLLIVKMTFPSFDLHSVVIIFFFWSDGIKNNDQKSQNKQTTAAKKRVDMDDFVSCRTIYIMLYSAMCPHFNINDS